MRIKINMSKDKINVYISSKHRLESEKANDFIVKFPSGLIKCDPKKEYMVMNINGYIMMNSFYNIQSINNTFEINVEGGDKYTYQIPTGNYNVIEMLDWLNANINTLLIVEYSASLNKYVWKNHIIPEKKITIRSITANDFIGFYDNKDYVIESGSDILSEKPINMRGDELICLQMPTIKQTQPCIDNFNGDMIDSSIVAYLPINVPAFGLMIYENRDGGDSFSYRIENDKIDELRLVSFNQDKENIDVGDFFLSIQFEIFQKKTANHILSDILKMVEYIFQLLGRKK